MDDNLPELRDIHLPLDTSFIFPLAKGWFIIICAIICAVVFAYIIVMIRRKSKKIYALKLLSKLDISEPSSIIKMSEILRRVCVHKYPKAVVLLNDEWIQFLNNHCNQKLEEEPAKLLLNAPYINPQKISTDKLYLKRIQDFCIKWIGENL